MHSKENDRFEELQSTVAQLGNALLLSEQRTARLERIIRWTTLSTALVLGLAVLVAVQPLGFAIAQQQAAAPSKSVEQAVDRLTDTLTGQASAIGMMGQMMGEMMRVGVMSAMDEARRFPASLTEADCEPGAPLDKNIKELRIKYQLGFYTRCYFLTRQISRPTQQDYQAAVMAAAGGTAVDMGVLMARLRDDSDMIRRFIVNYTESSEDALAAIKGELHDLNQVMISVPIMAQHMGVMTADMNSMTHSMGSTMGRMGNWMPW